MRNVVFVCRPWSDARLACRLARAATQPAGVRFATTGACSAHDTLATCRTPLALLALALGTGRRLRRIRRGGVVEHGRRRAAQADVHGLQEGRVGQPRPRVELEAEGGDVAARRPGQREPLGPVPGAGRRQAAEFGLDAAFEGGGQSSRPAPRRPARRATSRSRAPTTSSPTRSSSSSRPATRRRRSRATDENQQSFASLGMDPRNWLTDPKNAGEAKVGDDDTIKITGGVDVAQAARRRQQRARQGVVARAGQRAARCRRSSPRSRSAR